MGSVRGALVACIHLVGGYSVYSVGRVRAVLSVLVGNFTVNIVISTPLKPIKILYVRHALGGKH